MTTEPSEHVSDQTDNAPETESEEGYEPIVARAGSYYRNARYIMFVIIVTMGAWFLYDGLVTYPKQNEDYDRLTLAVDRLVSDKKQDTPEYLSLVTELKKAKHHDEFSVRLQVLLGLALPPAGICLLIFWLKRSRGEIRLEDDVLTAPGCPPVPLEKIDELDRTLWDKKGIAFAYYDLGGGNEGKIRLDDFIYQAQPIRLIVAEIQALLKERQMQAELEAITPPRPKLS